ncbi:MAG: DUF2683 family protein [Mucilaginibacter sp.]
METLIVQPKNQKQLDAVEAVLKALNVTFKKEEKSPYKPEFVAKIKKSQKQIQEGDYVAIDPAKPIWDSIL